VWPDSLPEPPAAALPVPLPRDEEIGFSRIVRATAGQLVEIPFRGTGWVYLGELGSRRGIVYDSRRIDPEGQSFVFRAEAAGTYALKFYKQDFIRDYILNDHVQVIIGEAPETAGSGWFNPPLERSRVQAEPRWPTALEEAELRRNGGLSVPAVSGGQAAAVPPARPGDGSTEPETAAQTGTDAAQAAGTTAPAVAGNAAVPAVKPPVADEAASEPAADSPPEMFLQKAREAFEAGKVVAAIALLDQFSERYPSGSDESCWLYGQFYEANSPSRNILAALDHYRRLIREYPQSGRSNDARRRIAYLERFYINIR
jgi:hypothetical protein